MSLWKMTCPCTTMESVTMENVAMESVTMESVTMEKDVVREVNTGELGAHYLCHKKKGKEKVKMTSALRQKMVRILLYK